MGTPKYKQYYQLMTDQNEALFNEFQPIHDAFAVDRSQEDEFHTVGRDVLDVMRDWERRLCSGMERGRYAGYSAGVAEKFWEQIKKRYPAIEEVGVRVKKPSS